MSFFSKMARCEAGAEAAPAPEEPATIVEKVVEAVEAVIDPTPSIEVKSAPVDMRFPTSNQARHCYTRYNEYHKCVKEKGEGAEECKFYQKAYWSLCPNEWVTKWNEEREAGTFAGKY